jgi:hypothetical protein
MARDTYANTHWIASVAALIVSRSALSAAAISRSIAISGKRQLLTGREQVGAGPRGHARVA